MQAWLDSIGIPLLLDWAPSGSFEGCGGTAEFLSYLMRTRPSNKDEIWHIKRQSTWYDGAVESKVFQADQLEPEGSDNDSKLSLLSKLEEALLLIRERLDKYEYVQVSFTNESEDIEEETPSCEEIVDSFKTYLFSKPPAELFDHAFVLVKLDSIIRFKSYLGEYGPRTIPWNNYEADLRDLFMNPHSKWKEIFGVDCDPKYNLDRVRIVVNN